MGKPIAVTIRATPEGIRKITVDHDHEDREAALEIFRRVVPAALEFDATIRGVNPIRRPAGEPTAA